MNTITPSDDIGKLMGQDCYLFFYFTASWCAPCKHIYPDIERLSQEHKEKVQFYKIDIDENEELSSTWNIKSVPTFYLLHNNNLLGSCSGADINKVKELLLIIKKEI